MHLILLQDALESLLKTTRILLIANAIVALFLGFDLFLKFKEWRKNKSRESRIINHAKNLVNKINLKLSESKKEQSICEPKDISEDDNPWNIDWSLEWIDPPKDAGYGDDFWYELGFHLERKMNKCPRCGRKPRVTAIAPHSHYLVKMPDFGGGLYVECSCRDYPIGSVEGVGIESQKKLVDDWNSDRFYPRLLEAEADYRDEFTDIFDREEEINDDRQDS